MLKRIPKSRAEGTAWLREMEQKAPARFCIFMLTVAAVLMVAHYTVDELGYHPGTSLWKARAFWSDAWMYAATPFVNWVAWRFLSGNRVKTLKPILTMSIILCVGSALALCLPNMLQSFESLHLYTINPPIEKWHWFTFRFYWQYWTPAVLAIGNLVLFQRWRQERATKSSSPSNTSAPSAANRTRLIVKVAAVTSVIAGCGAVAFYVELPRLPADEDIVSLARTVLVQPRLRNDFDYLAQNSLSDGQPLAPLLEQLKLAERLRRQFYSNLDDVTFRKYILSPEIASLPLDEVNWRQTLWEIFYPSVRSKSDPGQAARIVIRLLREHVGIDSTYNYRVGVETIWTEEMTDESGFERIYVAALRSVGIAARLNGAGQAELLEGNQWESAPRPLIASFETKKFPVPKGGLVNFRNWAGDDWPQ
jgi:hypothetical protein